MTSINLTANGSFLYAKSSGKITSGMVGVPVNIKYDESWDGLTKTAFFRVGNQVRKRENISTATIVPWEILRNHGKPLEIGVEGRDSDGNIVVPTIWAMVSRIYEGASGDIPASSIVPPNPTTPAVGDFVEKDKVNSVSDRANAVGVDCFAGAKAYQIIAKAADSSAAGADGYYVLAADAVPEENIVGQAYAVTMIACHEFAGYIRKVGSLETGLSGIDSEGNHVTGLTGFKVYVDGYLEDELVDNTADFWDEETHLSSNTFRIHGFPLLGNIDYGRGAWAGGYQTKALGIAAHAEGAKNTARTYGHVEGINNQAIGVGTHVEGAWNLGYGDFSHVGGDGNRAFFANQTVIGTYNQNKVDTLFEVGVGSGEDDRKNGFEVKKDGSARVLAESTEPDAVVRYSQLERTAVGFTNVVDTAISLNFEDDVVDQTPAGWTEVTPSTDPEKYYVKVKDYSGNQVLRVNSVNAVGTDYFVQYALPEKVTNLKLEYKVKLAYITPSAYQLHLPSINYTGVATNSNKNSTPLSLFALDGGRLYYSFTDAAHRVQIPGTFNNSRWYNVKMEVDLRAGTRSLSVGTDSEVLVDLQLPMTDAEAVDWSTATLDRISVGAFAQYGGSLLLDDITLSWEHKSETCALTVVKDGDVQRLYPVTKPEAVEGLKDYVAACVAEYFDNYIKGNQT